VLRTLPGQFQPSAELLYHDHQIQFWKALDEVTAAGRPAWHRLALFAGRRGGKTKAGAIAAVKKLKQRNSLGWICAPTYRDLEDFVIPEVFRFLPPSWLLPGSDGYQMSSKTIRTRWNAIAQFRSLEDPETARGPGLDWAWLDEARKIQRKAWETMVPALVDKKGMAWVTTSPNGPDWVYDAFWTPAKVKAEPGYWACRYKTLANPYIDPVEIEKARKDMDPLFFQQEFEADFVSFQGAVYGASFEHLILRTDEEIRRVLPDWPKINPTVPCLVGIDVGVDHPFAAVMLVSTPKGLVVVGEHLARRKGTVFHVNAMRQMLARFDQNRPFEPETWAIDRSAALAAIDLSTWGIYAAQAPNKVPDGIRRVQTWINANQIYFVERLCPELIQQMRGYRYAERTRTDGGLGPEDVVKIDDDLPDALRYILMTYPALPERELQAESQATTRLLQIPERDRWAYERMMRMKADERDPDFDPAAFGGLMGALGVWNDAGEDLTEAGLGNFWGTG